MFERFFNGFRKKTETRDFSLKSPETDLLNFLVGGIASRAGVTVNPVTVLGVPTVYACVRRVANTLATTPIHLCRYIDGATEKVTANPLYDLVALNPNPWMSNVDFFDAVQAQATLRQNGIAIINRDAVNRPVELVPVSDIRDVTWKLSKGELIYTIKNVEYPNDRILHIRSNAPDGITGRDIISLLRNSIGLAIALQDNAADFFSNGSRPSGVFETGDMLSDKAFARLKSSLNAKWGDATDATKANAYGTLLLEEGLSYKQVRHSNSESQMDETRSFQNIEICKIFGVPPHKVGILDKATFSNIEEQSREYITDTIMPWVVRWEAELNRKLLSATQRRQGFHYKFNLDSQLRATLKDRYDAYQIGILNGIINKNEAREKEGLAPYDGGEIFIEPMNHAPVGDSVTDQADSRSDDDYESREHLWMVPTASMAKYAARALEWRAEFNRGGTAVGVARARDIKNRKTLSQRTVNRMRSYFARHEVDKQAEGFNSGEDGFPSAGRIAWDLWGGNEAKTWAAARGNDHEENEFEEINQQSSET